MIRRLAFSSAILVVASAMIPLRALAEHQQVPVMRVHSEIEVQAKPGTVWSCLTNGRNLVTWCPQWKSSKNKFVSLTKVGDVLDYADEWGNGGRSVVTYIDKGKELRVAHEPTNGSYMCQAKLVLTPSGNGTKVQMWDQYTDESAPADMAATADKMDKEMDETLAALKKACESSPGRMPSLHVTK
jgi:hypothetical protein